MGVDPRERQGEDKEGLEGFLISEGRKIQRCCMWQFPRGFFFVRLFAGIGTIVPYISYKMARVDAYSEAMSMSISVLSLDSIEVLVLSRLR